MTEREKGAEAEAAQGQRVTVSQLPPEAVVAITVKDSAAEPALETRSRLAAGAAPLAKA